MYLKFLLAMLITFTALAEENGYEVFTKAYEKVNKREFTEPDFSKSVDNPKQELSSDILALLKKYESVMDGIARSGQLEKWVNPSLKDQSADTLMPNLLKQQLIVKLAVLRARTIQKKARVKAFSLLNGLYLSSLRESKGNALIQTLVMVASRNITRETMVQLIDEMDKEELNLALKSLQTSYSYRLKQTELFDGDIIMCANTIQGLFKDIEKQQEPSFEAIIKDLDNSDLDEETKKKIRSKVLSSFDDWERRVLLAQKEYWEGVVARVHLSEKEMRAYQKTVDKRWAIEGKSDDIEELLEVFTKAIKEGEYEAIKKGHEYLGDRVTHIVMSMLMPSLAKAVLKYRNHLAYERLLQIHVARRLYKLKSKQDINSLNDLVKTGLVGKEILIDPHTNKSMIFNQEIKKVYSLGQDLKDDKGKPFLWYEKTGDIILEFPKEDHAGCGNLSCKNCN